MTIESKITEALSSRKNTSQALAQLIVEAETAITEAEQSAEAERKRALDPVRSPDPAQARQAMETAAFVAERLRTLLPRLQQCYDQVVQAEQYTAWVASFDAIKPRHAAAAAKLREVYTAFAAKLVEALTEAKQVDAEVHRISNMKPWYVPQANGDGRTLPTVEAAARGLPGVNPDYSIMKLRLPVWDKPNQLAWPPHEVPLGVLMAAATPTLGDPRSYTGEWWKVQQERTQSKGNRHETQT